MSQSGRTCSCCRGQSCLTHTSQWSESLGPRLPLFYHYLPSPLPTDRELGRCAGGSCGLAAVHSEGLCLHLQESSSVPHSQSEPLLPGLAWGRYLLSVYTVSITHSLCVQETYRLLQERVPLRLKSYLHRHDIVFSQAVTVTVTSFVFRLLQSFAFSSFLAQLQQVV